MHTDSAPLHRDFYNILKKVAVIDLSTENLRYANFCNAFLPKVNLPRRNDIEGADLCNADLQGASLSLWGGHREEERQHQPEDINGADVSGGSLVSPIFEDQEVRLTAIGAKVIDLLARGVTFSDSDLRFATFERAAFVLNKTDAQRNKNSIDNSNFSGAVFVDPQFHATQISRSKFIGATLESPLFFSGTEILNSDFSLARMTDSQSYKGSNLVTWRDTRIHLTAIEYAMQTRHTFDRSMHSDTKSENAIPVMYIVLVPPSRPYMGPIWISWEPLKPEELLSLRKKFAAFWLIQDGKNSFQRAVRRAQTAIACFSTAMTLSASAKAIHHTSALCPKKRRHIFAKTIRFMPPRLL
jgi:uncharacterized protein YjbI with pentapeptide repeats